MKLLRFLASFALVLTVSVSALAKSDWEKFEAAEKKGDWAKAAKLIPLVEPYHNERNDRPEALELYANVREHLGDHVAALRYRERVVYYHLWHWTPTEQPQIDEIYALRLSKIQAVAAYALRTKQTSEDRYVAAYAKHLAGDTPGAIAAFHALCPFFARNEAMRFAWRIQRELYATHFKEACDKNDWDTAAALGRAMQFEPPDPSGIPALLAACEKAGDHDAVVRIRYDLLWRNPKELKTTVSPRHTDEPNPELLKEIAAYAHTHPVKTDFPLLNAWIKHLSGDSAAALADLEKPPRVKTPPKPPSHCFFAAISAGKTKNIKPRFPHIIKLPTTSSVHCEETN